MLPVLKNSAASHMLGWLRIKASSIRDGVLAGMPDGTGGSVAAEKLDPPFVENHTAPSRPVATTFDGMCSWNFTSRKIPESGTGKPNGPGVVAGAQAVPPSVLRHSPVPVAAKTLCGDVGDTAIRLTK